MRALKRLKDIMAQLQSASRMILENQKYFHGCDSREACDTVDRNFADLFTPPDSNWRLKAMREADYVFSKLTEGPWGGAALAPPVEVERTSP